jgi:hypothetical protein
MAHYTLKIFSIHHLERRTSCSSFIVFLYIMKFPSQISIQRTCSDLAPYKSHPLPVGWETTDMTGTNLYLHRTSGTITAKDPRKPAPVPLRRRVVSFFERHAVKMKVTMTIKRQRTTSLPAYSTTYPYSIMMRVLTPKKSGSSILLFPFS